jgi:translation initiation factor 3 subunit C
MDDFLSLDDWRKCFSHLMRIVELLEADPSLRLTAAGSEDMADMILAQQGALKELTEADKAKTAAAAAAGGPIKVMGNLFSLVTRLDEEYTKALQNINPHTEEYIERLRLESQLVKMCRLVQLYFERSEDMATAAQVALLCIEHMYYKHDSIAHSVAKATAFSERFGAFSDLHPACQGSASPAKLDASKVHPASVAGKPTIEFQHENAAQIIQELCNRLIYRHGEARVRTRAMLCHIAHLALHDRFYDARDLLLMSHLQDNITMADVSTQILFNRAMAMLGLCAFRAGLIWEAHQCLMDICSSRVKELLAQGVQSMRYPEKNPEQEKAERRRQVPYHMHLNQDLLEACHLISAMLLEVPNMATEQASDRKAYHISRFFRKHVDYMERQPFTGPPENTRDHVLVAAMSLMTGDWKRCSDLILDGLDVWNLIPGEGAAAKVKSMLLNKIKCEALRTYLFAYSIHYDSLSLVQLCRMFGLDKRTANGVISKMMINQVGNFANRLKPPLRL